MVHIYTGDGKGKTTAAVGLSVRFAGTGQKVVFTQFLKDNTSGELKILGNMEGMTLVLADEVFDFYYLMSEEDKVRAAHVYDQLLRRAVKTAEEQKAGMLVLDELMSAYQYEFIDRKWFLEFLKNSTGNLEVVMTGRDPAPELLEAADYISEIKKVRHPYDKGVPARDGIEK